MGRAFTFATKNDVQRSTLTWLQNPGSDPNFDFGKPEKTWKSQRDYSLGRIQHEFQDYCFSSHLPEAMKDH